MVLIAGGNANNGANDGPFYWNWNNTASNSNWNYGARPPLLMLRNTKYQRPQDCLMTERLYTYVYIRPYLLVKI